MNKNEYIIEGDVTTLIINSNINGVIKVLIDTDDYPKVCQYTWNALKQHSGNYYILNSKTRNNLHRLITECPNDKIVDHINRNTLDNRKQNLRVCDHKLNSKNRETKSNTGIRYIHRTLLKGRNAYYVNVQKIGCKNNVFRSLDKAKIYLLECYNGFHRREEK